MSWGEGGFPPVQSRPSFVAGVARHPSKLGP